MQLCAETEGPLAFDTVMMLARRQVTFWNANADRLVTLSRGAYVTSRVYALSEASRVVHSIVNSLLARCSTVSMFSSIYSVGTKRWMTAMLLVSAIFCMLMVQIWLYWSKSQICCGDARVLLGCGRDHAASLCHGFPSYCADLQNVHYPFAAAGLYGTADGALARAVPLPQCEAFPSESARDTFLAGLISAACALPFTALVSTLFSLSLSTDAQQMHAHVRVRTWPLWMRLLMGSFGWRFDSVPRTRALRARLSRWWVTTAYTDAVVAASDAALATASLARSCVAADEHVAPGAADAVALPDVAAAQAFDALTTRFRYAGFAFLYATWGAFVWIVLVYGNLIYELMGPAMERQFTLAWAAGVGLDQLQSLQSFIVTALEALLLITILETLWVMPNGRWLETQLDYASVVATSLAPERSSWGRRCFRYMQHMKTVQG